MYKGRPVCEPLDALNEEQAKFCSATLYKIAPELMKVLGHREMIRINWINSPIEVNEGGQKRAVDAVANREKNEITINQPRFLHMQQSERVFLLSHEYMHFASLDGKPLEDRGEVGPFKGGDGSRDLINSMAAATAVMQGTYPKEIKSYKAKLSRSQAWKTKWITLDVGGASVQGGYTDSFQFSNYTRTQLTMRYQFTNWGVALSYRNETANKTVLGTIAVGENVNTLGAGVTYRIFPFSDPLTFWGQSHILLQAMAEYVKADINYSEDPIFNSGSTSTFGGSLAVNYYLPLFWGTWGYVGVAYEVHPYKYTEPDVNLNFNKNIFSEYLGVGYAF